ncbi:MAG: DUF1800 family protein [Alphaproteobacteria bacterium]|nr:DUF1800 family protein [Alphaproteobacteria bacterium]
MSLPDARTQAAIATNRFGIGARPGEIAEASGDPRGWLLRQVAAGPSPIPGGARLPTSAEAIARADAQARLDEARARARETKAEPTAMAKAPAAPRYDIYTEEVAARGRSALETDRPFPERLVWFWSNHFSVSVDKAAVRAVAGAMEREAIRPHVLGRFEDMLLAVIHHPAMIFYLDNQLSLGPASPRGEASRRGLNENLGREVMELHTVGVSAGYTQADVTTFAKALTGWTVDRREDAGRRFGTFLFSPDMHEPGPKTIMGRTYPQEGEDQAVAVLQDLARHPATARHIAGKLARHFIADRPPEAAVDALAHTFLDTGGDLTAVARRLVALDVAWSESPDKLKSPNEYIVSAMRGLGVETEEAVIMLRSVSMLGQRPFAAPSPAGWPDTAQDWAAPSAVYQRLEWAARVGQQVGPGLRQPGSLVGEMLGGQARPTLADAVDRAASGAQAVALLLASPEFQWR